MTKVEIANMALIRLGQDPIISLDDDVKGARTIKAVWDMVRDSVLREHLWNFAIKRATLAQLDEEAENWTVFGLPADCLRVVSVDGADNWRVENGRLLADGDSVKIKYIARVDDPSLYDPTFAEAFALRLAIVVAYSLVGSAEVVKQLWDEYLYKFGSAVGVDGQEGTGKIEFESNWTRVR